MWPTLLAGLALKGLHMLWVRVTEEEAMLKGEFGEEWEEYHRRTGRFIAGVFQGYSPFAQRLWRPKLLAGRRRIE